MMESRGGRGLGWGVGGQGDEVVGFLPQPPHPTTHTPLLPSPLDGHLLIQKK